MNPKIYKQGKYDVKDLGHIHGQLLWYYKGKLHREDGPAAFSFIDGKLQWFLNGKYYLEKDWIKEMRKRKLKELGI